MSKIRARGQLIHQFHGTYNAIVVLAFKSEAHARDALRALGAPWKLGKKTEKAVFASVATDELEMVKVQLAGLGRKIVPCTWKHCRDKCKSAEIDGLPHSIDYGPAFEVDIPCVPEEQKELF